MSMTSPPHPGKLVEAAIADLKLPITTAARALGVSRQQLYNVMWGRCGVSPEMAVRLERALGRGTAEHWLALQARYDLAHVGAITVPGDMGAAAA